MIRVSSVAAEPNYYLALTFSNGEQRRFDMRPYLHFPIYRRLENPGFFVLARAGYGNLVLPGE